MFFCFSKRKCYFQFHILCLAMYIGETGLSIKAHLLLYCHCVRINLPVQTSQQISCYMLSDVIKISNDNVMPNKTILPIIVLIAQVPASAVLADTLSVEYLYFRHFSIDRWVVFLRSVLCSCTNKEHILVEKASKFSHITHFQSRRTRVGFGVVRCNESV